MDIEIKVSYYYPTHIHGKKLIKLFKEAEKNLIKEGYTIKFNFICRNTIKKNINDDSNILILWGAPNYNKKNCKKKHIVDYFKKKNKKVIIIDHGFINRIHNFQIQYNSISSWGTPLINEKNIEQPNINFNINKKKNILFCAQNINDVQITNIMQDFDELNYNDLVINKLKAIRKVTNKKIIFRNHPTNKKKNNITFKLLKENNIKNIVISKKENIKDDILDSYIVISFNSSSLIDALLLGRLTIALHTSSLVYSLNNKIKNINNPIVPSKNKVINVFKNILIRQWTRKEISSGYPLIYALKN